MYFSVVGVKLAVKHDFATGAGLRIVVAQHRALDFAAINALLDNHFMVKLKRQRDGLMVLRFRFLLADATDEP